MFGYHWMAMSFYDCRRACEMACVAGCSPGDYATPSLWRSTFGHWWHSWWCRHGICDCPAEWQKVRRLINYCFMPWVGERILPEEKIWIAILSLFSTIFFLDFCDFLHFHSFSLVSWNSCASSTMRKSWHTFRLHFQMVRELFAEFRTYVNCSYTSCRQPRWPVEYVKFVLALRSSSAEMVPIGIWRKMNKIISKIVGAI